MSIIRNIGGDTATVRVRNVSDQDLVVPWLGRLVLAGQVVDVPAGDAESYTCQPTTWQAVRPADDDDPTGDPPGDDPTPGTPPADHEEG